MTWLTPLESVAEPKWWRPRQLRCPSFSRGTGATQQNFPLSMGG